jgi:hypothetical protein
MGFLGTIYLIMSPEIITIRENAETPGCVGVFYNLVFTVSIGALHKGPIAPEMRPMAVVWYDGRGEFS